MPYASRLFTPLFIVALVVTLFMAFDPQPPHLPIDSLGDKFAHSLAFVTLTVLATLAFPRVKRWRLFEHLSFLGAMIEVVQATPSLHRDCDWRDWVGDTIAIAVTTLALRAIGLRRA